ncbi:MAG: DUF3261 domain-containing protein [Acidobacteriota bacterium]|nr:DUF3261 domain-containing protein [Acidobacteriota bacterium]
MIKTGRVVRLAVFLAAAEAACLGPVARLQPPDIRIAGGAAWPDLPVSYRMIHRIHVDIRGRSLDFLGYLAVAGNRWRAVAFTEMGGRLFDLISENGRPEVLLSPRGLPRAALLDGVMRDIEAAFVPAARIGRAPDRPAAAGGGERAAMILQRGGKTVSEISLVSTRTVDGWAAAVPERLLIKSPYWGYTMDVTLVRLDLRPIDDTVFLRGEVRK